MFFWIVNNVCGHTSLSEGSTVSGLDLVCLLYLFSPCETDIISDDITFPFFRPPLDPLYG